MSKKSKLQIAEYGCGLRDSLAKWICGLFFLFFCVRGAWADPTLPHVISDNAVFQQGRAIPVWGRADAGEQITVSFAGHDAATQADSSGHWSVHLPAMTAGGPFTLQVAGKKTIEVKNVMIGEVWIASGQSNMTFELRGSEGAEQELPKANYPEIRLFMVPKRVSRSEQADTLPANWQPCTPESAKKFSAVAYYFARDLYNKLHVPIGIVDSAWPGTAIEEWIPAEAGRKDPSLQPMLDAWSHREGKGYVDGRLPFALELDDFELIPPEGSVEGPLLLADFDKGLASTPWGGTWTFDFREAPGATFELEAPGRAGHGYAASVKGSEDASDDPRLEVHYRADNTPIDLSRYAGIRFWVRGDGTFRFRSLQPTITDWDDYAYPILQAGSEWKQITIQFRDLRQDGWGVVREFTPQALTGFVLEPLPSIGYPLRTATALYGGMIAPLMHVPFRGVIWYQGEGNALRAQEYRKLLPALIESWRAASQQPQMQFLIVQLPNHGEIPKEPGDSAWAELREAQFLTAQKVPGTGLAVTIDVGDPKDLHPHRKAEVGGRLAIWALGTIYRQPIVSSGPLFRSMTIEGSQIRIRFTDVGGGLMAKGAGLEGFAIAGADREFHWATARVDGDSVVVSSAEVNAPVAVRYAWGDSPTCNLFNAEGLPASPFRTDDWPRRAQ